MQAKSSKGEAPIALQEKASYNFLIVNHIERPGKIEGSMTPAFLASQRLAQRCITPRCIAMGIALALASQFISAQPQSAVPSALSSASTSPRSIAFDVVSIRRNTTGTGIFAIASPQDGDSITVTNMSPHMMIGFAYDLSRHDEIVGLPDWTDTESYDIVAKVAAADLPTFRRALPRQRNPMLQPLLADRFHLKCHYETRELPIYALVAAKNGPKLTEVKPAVDAEGREISGGVQVGRGEITAHAAPIGAVLDALAVQLGQSVVDRTGLKSRYDFTLQFTPVQASTSPESQAGNDTSGPTIFTAIQEQLGLRLEPSKGPVQVLVVDHIERPGEN